MSKPAQPPLKKEFVTYWDQEPVKQMAFGRMKSSSQFFREMRGGKKDEFAEIIFPSDIRHDQLMGFQNKKTKITIEVIE